MTLFQNGKRATLSRGAPRWALGRPAATEACDRFLMPDGSVRWLCVAARLPYVGSLCMAGHRARFCLYYCVAEGGGLVVRKHCEYPFLGAGGYAHDYDYVPLLYADGALISERVSFIDVKGTLRVVTEADGWRIERVFYPAVQSVGLVEKILVTNLAPLSRTVRVEVPSAPDVLSKGVGTPVVSGVTLADDRGRMLTDLSEDAECVLPPDGEGVFHVVYWSKPRADELMVDCRLEWKKRVEQISDCFSDTLSVSTPDPRFDASFAHCLLSLSEHLVDSPLGVFPLGNVSTVSSIAEVLPLLSVCGIHRADLAVTDFLEVAGDSLTDKGMPQFFDVAGQPIGKAPSMPYVLALARFSLLAGAKRASRHFAVIERFVERCRKSMKEGLYTPKRVADLPEQCMCYALFTEASRLALSLDMSRRASLWQEAAQSLRRRVCDAYGAMDVYRLSRLKPSARLYAPLLFGMDDVTDGVGRVLIARWLSEAQSDPMPRMYADADSLRTVYALFRAGYTDAAQAWASALADEILYSPCAPYPSSNGSLGVRSPYLAGLYCRSLLFGWLGLSVLSLERVAFCLHLPKAWRRFVVRGLHLGSVVLDVLWREDRLLVRDIFGQVYYDDLALCGQHVEVELPH